MLSKKLATVASSLLLACSLALAGATAANSAHDGHIAADSWWGVVVTPADEAVEEPAPAVTPGPEVSPNDSAWG